MSIFPPDYPQPWSPETRDRSFLVLFIASLIAVLVVFSPFLDALLLASATVVVSWPLYDRVRVMVGGRAYAAAGITTTAVVLLVLVPVTLLAIWCVQEAAGLVQTGVELARAGTLRATVEQWVWTVRVPGQDRVNELLGTEVDLIALVVEPVQNGVVSFGQRVAASLPDLLGTLLGAGLDLFVFVFAVVTLYAEGPRLLRAAGRMSPLRPEYHRRLFEVFREFSTNLVFGALTTALVQAMIASIGFTIAGVPNLVFFGLLTAVFSFIPIVGTAVVWVPVSIWVGTTEGWGWGVFVFLWNASLTGTVDNVLRPLLLRGRSPIHPLLIFLSVLGGLYWLALPGALVGPVTVAVFLALYRIWTEELAAQGIRFTDATPAPVGWATTQSSSSSSSSSSLSASALSGASSASASLPSGAAPASPSAGGSAPSTSASGSTPSSSSAA